MRCGFFSGFQDKIGFWLFQKCAGGIEITADKGKFSLFKSFVQVFLSQVKFMIPHGTDIKTTAVHQVYHGITFVGDHIHNRVSRKIITGRNQEYKRMNFSETVGQVSQFREIVDLGMHIVHMQNDDLCWLCLLFFAVNDPEMKAGRSILRSILNYVSS